MAASSTERSPLACSKQIRSDVSNFNAFVNTWVSYNRIWCLGRLKKAAYLVDLL